MNAITPAFGCVTGGQPVALALERVLALSAAPLGADHVTLSSCAGRVRAAPIVARPDLPGFTLSAPSAPQSRSPRLAPTG